MRKSIIKLLGALLLLPLFAGCNDSDDVAAIFTGKTWKLNYITVDGGHEMFNFWDNEQQRDKSLKELQKNGTHNLKFEGTVEGDLIKGSIKGIIIEGSEIDKETWSANAKNNSFQASIQGNDGGDILAKRFIEGMNAATSYEGDSNNLYILYKSKSNQQTFRMVFYPTKSNN